MEFILLDNQSDFESLKKGDMVLVRWSEYYADHTPGLREIMLYSIHENKLDDKEIICQKRNNHYFNYDLYLSGKSNALEVYKVQLKN